jgi:hypothetical protein
MKKLNYAKLGGAVATATLLMAGGFVRAGDVTWDFETDPTTGANPLSIGGNAPVSGDPTIDGNWRKMTGEGSGSDGFLAITYAVGSQNGYALFPDIDGGKFITAFELTADIRSGNCTGDRAADGWSVSLAREGDPVISAPGDGASYGGAAEFGAQSGIAISFDTWQGNTFPDGSGDIEGLIVRIDGATVKTVALPTRHGDCDDDTSLQTGPRDPDYWAAGEDPYAPGAWSTLCWKQLRVVVGDQGQVSVFWKGRAILDNEPTDFYPSAGQLVLAGRTGGADSNVHFDNIRLVTTAVDPETEPPTAPGFLTTDEVGAARVALSWGESTDNSGRVGYEIERNGVLLPGVKTETSMEDGGVLPSTAYTYRVRATDVAGNKSAWVAAPQVTTAAEVQATGFVRGTIYDGIDGAIAIIDAVQDPIYTSGAFTRVRYLRGMDFNNFGDNYLIDIEGTFTVPVSGSYRFFIASDDASELFLNSAGPEIPDPAFEFPIAGEQGCCGPFEEVGNGVNPDGSFPTSEPIALTAGTRYGIRYLVKEGGGGDWGKVAYRMEGDTTPAANLQPIQGLELIGLADPVGTTVSISVEPVSTTVTANEPSTLSVEVAFDKPASYAVSPVYQWYKNGQAVVGANSTNLVFATTPSSAAGDYSFKAYLLGVEAESAVATLTVDADNIAPTVVSVGQNDDMFTSFTVQYSEPLTAAGTYTLDQGATVSSAALSADGFSVTLTTSALAVGTDYALSISGATDKGGNAIAAGTVETLTSWSLVASRSKIEIWDGFGGAGLADMDVVLNDASYPDSPSRSTYSDWGAYWDTYGDNHMVMMRFWYMAPETGSYRFFVRGDDACRVYVSSNDQWIIPTATTPTPDAIEAGCCGPFEEVGAGDNGDGTFPTSEPIAMTGGNMYAITVLTKEGGGGDWAQLAARMEGDATAAGNLSYISADAYYYGAVVATEPTLGLGVEANGDVTITFEGTLESSASLDGTYAPVEGATSPYTVTPSGTMFYRATN